MRSQVEDLSFAQACRLDSGSGLLWFRGIAPLTIIASFLWNGAHWGGVYNHLIKRVLLRDLGAF